MVTQPNPGGDVAWELTLPHLPQDHSSAQRVLQVLLHYCCFKHIAPAVMLKCAVVMEYSSVSSLLLLEVGAPCLQSHLVK